MFDYQNCLYLIFAIRFSLAPFILAILMLALARQLILLSSFAHVLFEEQLYRL